VGDKACVLVELDPIHVVLEKQADGRLRFVTRTVKRIATMRLESFRRQREIQESRMKLAEGRTDPESTPNSIIANVSIDNRGARNSRRYRTFVGVAYDTPADRLIAMRDGLRAYARAQPKIRTDKIDVYVHTLSSSTIDLLLNFYFTVASSAEELAARDELNREILEQAARFGVQVSPPSQTLLLSHGPEANRAIPPPRRSIVHKRSADTGNGESVKVRLDS